MSAVELSPIKRALIEIRELRARVHELEATADHEFAIVGASVRAPGGITDLASFGDLLWSGREAIGSVPANRWADSPQLGDDAARAVIARGGFIDDVDRFDAEFFGISPLEASRMDPQQRLVLELAWQALEDAGHAPSSLAGSATGIYLGIANGDYGRTLFERRELIDPYFSTGNAYSVASGRIAYLLGLHGPAISIDTACSSSLVAIHLACQALRARECDFALAGGVNLLLAPELSVCFARAGMLSADGRCHTFDAAANGYVRSEGGAFVVLRRLHDALADGDRILAVVTGSAVNQDGRSNGLTAPNGPAQQAVIRAALAAARLRPEQVDYVEAHGTGTPLGDPIEVNALAAALGGARSALQPLLIGAVKSNLGHLEAAAGIVGLLKAVLVVQRGEVPPHPHLHEPNPLIDWRALPLHVPREVTPLTGAAARRVAGVSSFGFSGTNAHVLIASAPSAVDRAEPAARRPQHVLALSARDPAALVELAAWFESRLAAGVADLADLCFTANVGRSHFAHRLAVSGGDATELADALRAVREGRAHPNASIGIASAEPPRIGFLFPGQGPAYAGTCRALWDSSPVFRAALEQACEALAAVAPTPVLAVLLGEPGASSGADDAHLAQPAMFAIEVALTSLWRSWGVEADAALGHSFGEYAAAWAAGALSLADAARMVTLRARLTGALPPDGTMQVVEAAEADVEQLLRQRGGSTAIAAVNGPLNTVISGPRAEVDAIVAEIAAQGRRVKALRVANAFHSPLVDPVLDEFERGLAGVEFRAPALTLVSSSRARVVDLGVIGDPRYWRSHLRDTVRFADAMRVMHAQRQTHYLELGPQPVLLSMAADNVSGAEWLASLRDGVDPWTELLASLRALYCAGAAIDWQGFDAGHVRRRVPLPTYPFQRRRHWIEPDGFVSTTASRLSADDRWARLTDAMAHAAGLGPLGLDVHGYPEKWAALERLMLASAARTLRSLDVFVAAGESHTLDEILARTGIRGTYRHLLQRWLDGLVRRGELERRGERFVAVDPLAQPDLDASWREVERELADNAPLLAYVRRCSELLRAVLTGSESPLETLFPRGDFTLAQDLYERSSTMRYINPLAAAAIETVAATTPGVLRVLEIGGGTGGTTSSLLRALPPDRTRYRFTDVGAVFLEHARSRFANHRCIEYSLLDLDADLVAQGYGPASVDVIVAANAVHAVKDLRGALGRLRSLLAPGGTLLLVESTAHLAYFDMTTGLIEGWQHFADGLRDDNPLLPPAAWTTLLRESGFIAADAWPSPGSPAETLGQHVIVARAPGEPLGGVAVAASGVVVADERAAPASSERDRRAELATASAPEQLDLLRALVRDELMQLLRLDESSPPARHHRFLDIGMDSLMAVQLRNRLGNALALEQPLPSTLIFDHPTIDAVAAFLLTCVDAGHGHTPAIPAERAAPAPVVAAATIAAMSDDDIARLLDARAMP